MFSRLVKLQTLSLNLSLGSLCNNSDAILESFEQKLSKRGGVEYAIEIFV